MSKDKPIPTTVPPAPAAVGLPTGPAGSGAPHAPPTFEAAAGFGADPRDAEIALLRTQLDAQGDQIEQMMAMLKAGAVNAVDAVQEATSKAEQHAWRAEIAKGISRLSQDECNRRYPHGRFRFLCALPDGNGHPELSVAADNEVDAKARYLDVCGVIGAEKPVSVSKS